MCDNKVVLHYFDGRGRMECIRWVLAGCGVEFEEKFLKTKDQYEQMVKDGDLLFQQIPMVEMDGMKLVAVRPMISYIAGKYNIYGKDLKERVCIDMYVDGTMDLMALALTMPFMTEEEKPKQRELIKQRVLNRYFPVFEKALKNQEYLVGNKFSVADVTLLEAIYETEEVHPDILQNFPSLQAFKTGISARPSIKKFLEPGSKRKPIADEKYVNIVKSILFS